MASKSKAAATRASTRTKTTASSVPTTTTRTTRAASKTNLAAPSALATAAIKKGTSRKPLLSRSNSPDAKAAVGRKAAYASTTKLPLKTANLNDLPPDSDREPIKAFLRIRPHLGDGEPSSEPYLDPISDTAVRMSDPYTSHTRLSNVGPSSIYTFSHVFPSETQQPEFFTKTTLPLVRDLLEGESGLLFTYGVTNSGKTYTIQGGSGEGSAGILPRTLDVIFNSIEGLHGDGRFRPIRLQGIELADGSSSAAPSSPHAVNGSSLADILDDMQASTDIDMDIDPTVLKLDRNHEYTVWLSYSEVYNEKVYDLFASVDSADTPAQPGPSGIPRPTSTFLNLPLPSSQSHPLLLTRKALPVKSCPPSDSGLSAAEAGSAGKYVAGLRQIRVHSAAQAKALLRLGQLHRRVFGTLANSQSSRSHALVTIKILRVHRGERNDPTSIQTSRLTLVDLAGSERTKHTHTSGDRLREAGNINKSLMVLGQCMETLRSNQRVVARSLATSSGRVDTREVKKGLAVVPFRHSKLTEVLMDYFVGEGRAVMIVNVNPYDTGFDENSHVMRFAALAREVCTAPATAIPRAVSTLSKDKGVPAARTRGSEMGPHRRQVTISTAGPGRKASEAHLEVLEEDEELVDGDDDGGSDDEPINPLVDALFDEIEDLRTQLFEAEVRCAIVEATTREEVMEEMEERMRSMEKMYKRRLVQEVERNEKKMDAKIDMLNQSRPRPPIRALVDSDIEEDDGHQQDSEKDEIESDLEDDGPNETDELQDRFLTDVSRSPSPLAMMGAGKKKHAPLRATNADPALASPAHSESIDADTTAESDPQHDTTEITSDEDEDESSPAAETSSSGASAGEPARAARHGRASARDTGGFMGAAPSPIFEADVKAGRATASRKASGALALARLQRGLDGLSLQDGPRDSTAVVPDARARKQAVAHGGPGVKYVPKDGEVDSAKKRKRQLGKKYLLAEDEMDAVLATSSQETGRQLRRSVRR
ncbi:hypothetical protein AcW1_000304 [Taiwanofungus camphoratus]|nr:hypothetical protein AcW1_000304 [Antrodia cinnamomea]